MTESSTITNSEKRQANRDIARNVRARLVERFPLAFMPKGRPKLPLMIGIDKAIRQRWPEITRREVAYAVADYTSGPTYLRALVEGAVRVDLDGNPSSTVTAEHAADAKQRLEKREAKWRDRPGMRPVQQAAE